jgi:hemolysin III
MAMSGDEARSGPDPIGAARDAAEAAGERLGQARAGAEERIGAARDAAGRQVAAARETAAMAAHGVAHKLSQKPRLRGVTHQWAFFVSLGAGAALVLAASGARAVIAMSIYAVGLSAMLGTSALYHRVTWTPEVRRWMRRLDHTMIFVFIAGTYTPFALLVMHGTLADVVLIVVWATAAAGIVFNLVWISAPYWFTTAVYLSTGWVAIVTLPQLWEEIGPVGVGLLALGGALYSAGAVIYARRRPDPRPHVFGYHEIFHVLVIAAAAVQYAAVAIYALPEG